MQAYPWRIRLGHRMRLLCFDIVHSVSIAVRRGGRLCPSPLSLGWNMPFMALPSRSHCVVYHSVCRHAMHRDGTLHLASQAKLRG